VRCVAIGGVWAVGSPWQYDCNALHVGRANTYSFVHDGKPRILKPMTDDQIKSDVVLVMRKEKLHKAKPQQRLAKLQHEEHDARSVHSDIISAMPVDDKPVVLVSDKSGEVKLLIDERKDIAACVTPAVCVDIGVQTEHSCADRVSVHMVSRVDDRCFVRTPVRRFVGAAVHMHKGKDGRVRQLCGPGITHILQGRTKKVHVQQHRARLRVEKKVVAPKSKLMWRRKEAPSAESSQASREGGCGVVGRQDLKTANKRDAFVDITTPFQADPHTLGITLFEGGMIWAWQRR
jgi:hypothetical protein